MENETFICYHCENEIEGEPNYYTRDGEPLCDDCYCDNYFTCEDCGEVYHNDDGRYVQGIDAYVCDNCIDNYYICDDCGEYFREGDMHFMDDGTYCDCCYSDNEHYNDGYVIHSYHNRDIDINFKYVEKDFEDDTIYATKDTQHNTDNMLKFGMEIEVENNRRNIENNEMARMIRETYPELELVFEEDGSLSNGFEIITQPMTMNYIREHKKDFEGICKMLSDNGFTSHNGGTCGQHIHFSRTYFSDNEDKYVGKLLTFFERYKREIYKFSRRDSTRWCKWVSDDAGYEDKYYKSSKILCDYAKSNMGHGVAINLENRNTIEIRVFRGTLKYETLMSNFEFVNSLIHTIKECPTRKINFDKIVNYEGNEYIQNYCLSKEIYNSEYMSDETANIFKILQTKKDNYDMVKTDVKKNIEDAIADMVLLTKNVMNNVTEYKKENEESIRQLFNTTKTLQELITNNIDFINSRTLQVDDTKVEDNYREYIRGGGHYYSYNDILQFYQNIRNCLPNNDYTLELREKMENVITTLKEKYANMEMGAEI